MSGATRLLPRVVRTDWEAAADLRVALWEVIVGLEVDALVRGFAFGLAGRLGALDLGGLIVFGSGRCTQRRSPPTSQ